MRFIVYDATGRILRAVDCDPSEAAMQCGRGEMVMEWDGPVDDRFQEVRDGVVQEIPGIHEYMARLANREAQEEMDRLIRVAQEDILAANSLDELRSIVHARINRLERAVMALIPKE